MDEVLRAIELLLPISTKNIPQTVAPPPSVPLKIGTSSRQTQATDNLPDDYLDDFLNEDFIPPLIN